MPTQVPERGVYVLMSADLVGSTAFKNKAVNDELSIATPATETPWVTVFKRFYREFGKRVGEGSVLLKALGKARILAGVPTCKGPLIFPW